MRWPWWERRQDGVPRRRRDPVIIATDARTDIAFGCHARTAVARPTGTVLSLTQHRKPRRALYTPTVAGAAIPAISLAITYRANFDSDTARHSCTRHISFRLPTLPTIMFLLMDVTMRDAATFWHRRQCVLAPYPTPIARLQIDGRFWAKVLGECGRRYYASHLRCAYA